MKILPLHTVVQIAVSHREIAAVDVNIVRRRGGRSLRVPIAIKFAKLDPRLAVLRAAGDSDVVGNKQAALNVEVRRRFVIANAAAIHRLVPAILKNNSRNRVAFRSTELPRPSRGVSGCIIAGGIVNQICPKIPHWRVGRVLGVNVNGIGRGRLLRQVNAKRIRAWGDDYLVSRLGLFDFRVIIARPNVNLRCWQSDGAKEKHRNRSKRDRS